MSVTTAPHAPVGVSHDQLRNNLQSEADALFSLARTQRKHGQMYGRWADEGGKHESRWLMLARQYRRDALWHFRSARDRLKSTERKAVL